MTFYGVTKPSSVESEKILRLVKIKQWYIPYDGDSYKLLRSAGVPLVRFHENFLPTLQLLCKKHKFRGQLINFREKVLEPFLDKVGITFNRKPHCRATINTKSLRFETLKPEVFQAMKENTIPKLEDVLLAFFRRWGYKSTFKYSEHRGKILLVVDYWYDSEKLPIIPLAESLEELPPVRIKFGMTRITLKMGEKYLETIIEVSQGGIFKTLHTTRCLYSQMSSVKPMIHALMEVPNRDQYNFDNSAD